MGTITIGKGDSRWGGEWSRGGAGAKRGFTLVELLVVIAIIGILATLVLLQLGAARARARDTQRISHVNQIQGALELHWEDFGFYPAKTDFDGGSALAPYFQGTTTPNDPVSGDPYGYVTRTTLAGDIVGYHIWAKLEQNANALKSDADIDSSAGGYDTVGVNGAEPAPAAGSTLDCKTIDCYYDRGI